MSKIKHVTLRAHCILCHVLCFMKACFKMKLTLIWAPGCLQEADFLANVYWTYSIIRKQAFVELSHGDWGLLPQHNLPHPDWYNDKSLAIYRSGLFIKFLRTILFVNLPPN